MHGAYGYDEGVLQHYKFTGKERDAESGLDNFGARYDASSLGRFMTPDWAAKPVTVPYANFGDPQTLNLYAYVENAPVNRADADGHQQPQSVPEGCGNSASHEQSNDTQGGCSHSATTSSDKTQPAVEMAQAQAQQVHASAEQAAQPNDPNKAQGTSAAAVVASPTTAEEINAVVKPLVDSAVSAAEKGGSLLLDAGQTALGALAFVLTTSQKTADNAHDTIQPSESKSSPEPATAAGGAGKIPGHRSPLIDVLEHGLTGDEGEDFSRKAGRSVPRADSAAARAAAAARRPAAAAPAGRAPGAPRAARHAASPRSPRARAAGARDGARARASSAP